MRKRTLHIIFLLLLYAINISADNAESWRYYPAYNGISEIDSINSKCIFVLSSGNLYSINKQEGSVQTYNRITGLTDTGIKTMGWNSAAKFLMLIYDNSNIDLMTIDGSVKNIPDLSIKETTLSKTINHLFMKNQFAYISMGFGIVKVDVKKAEISDTYNLSENIQQTYVDDSYIYAKTDKNVVMKASLKDNLLDKNTWKKYEGNTSNMFKKETVSEKLLNSISSFHPDGPHYNLFGRIIYRKGKLITAENQNWDNKIPDCPQIYNIEKDEWTFIDNDNNIISDKTGINYVDFTNVEVDPLNENHIMASGHGGIYEFLDGNFVTLYTDTNTPMTSAVKGNSYYVLPSAMKYTSDGTLWVAISQATDNVTMLSMSKDKKWTIHNDSRWIYNNISLADVKNMIVDSRGIIWWVNDHWWKPALCGYDPKTEKSYCYSTFYNEDNSDVKPIYVRCVTEDMEGNLWIGTNVGPLMLENKNIPSSDEVIWQQIKVPRNDGTNFADYLLAGVDINCIMVDGANRKWFGTNGNGIYVIDSDNITQTNHFTSTSSMLLSDYVIAMEADPIKGDVYIGTYKGLCSYHSDATQAYDNLNEDNIYAYPNPVTPDYTGSITVTGLTFNADVKITTTSGQLVAQGRSNGGSYVWNGLDRNGKRVASGIYMVCISTADGKEGVATKIAIVR